MCELTFISTTNLKFNKLYLLIQLTENSRIHRDGTGVFDKSGLIFKTKLPAFYITNLASMLDRITHYQVMAHTRFISTKTSVNDENAHPFVAENVVVAHNGTLELKKGVIPAGYTDSRYFTEELNKNYNGNLPNSLRKTMELFEGKFAFIIYDKPKDSFYISRGETAKLFTTDILINNEKIGYVVNTDRDDLFIALNKIYQIAHFFDFKISWPDFTELKENSIYKAGSSLTFDSEIKENKKVVVYAQGGAYKQDFFTNSKEKISGVCTDSKDKLINTLTAFMADTGISLQELDLICFKSLGYAFLEMEEQDFNSLVDYVLPKLHSRIVGNPNLTKLWRELGGTVSSYAEYNLQFPYMLNKEKVLRRAIVQKKLKEEERKKETT